MTDHPLFGTLYTARALRRFKPDAIPEDVLFQLLDAAGPQLKGVCNYAVGTDNIDREACKPFNGFADGGQLSTMASWLTTTPLWQYSRWTNKSIFQRTRKPSSRRTETVQTLLAGQQSRGTGAQAQRVKETRPDPFCGWIGSAGMTM